MQKIDIYLSRCSQLVQIGLFVTTLLTIYYTVIPLYKSAQLEESLARKEAEYKVLELKAASILEKVNGWEYQQFVRKASECSGLPDVLLTSEKPEIVNRPPVEVDTCLTVTLNRFEFTDLSAEARSSIRSRVVNARSRLESIYQEYLNRYNDYPSKIDKDLREGITPQSTINDLDKVVGELGYKISDSQKRDSYISSGRLEITYGYFSAISDAIRAALGEKL